MGEHLPLVLSHKLVQSALHVKCKLALESQSERKVVVPKEVSSRQTQIIISIIKC